MYLDESGSEQPIVMGSYGIGPARIMTAAVEQRHDEAGICWPRALTPYDVHVVAIATAGPGDEASARPNVAGEALEAPGSASCSTTATAVPARSSRTPT